MNSEFAGRVVGEEKPDATLAKHRCPKEMFERGRVRLLEPPSVMQVAAGSSPVASAKRSDHSLKAGTTFIGADQPVSFGQVVMSVPTATAEHPNYRIG